MALTGTLQEMSVIDLIQHACSSRNASQLTIECQKGQAYLFFSGGQVVHAGFGLQTGEEVVYEVLGWLSGSFIFEIDKSTPHTTINRNWSSLIMDGVRWLDENNRKLEGQNIISSKEQGKMTAITEMLDSVMRMDGAIATAVVDWQSGLTLGTAGTGMNIELAAAGNTNVVRAKLNIMKDLKIKGGIEDIQITLTDQYHLICLVHNNPNLFVYVALDRQKANLGLARHQLLALENDLVV